MKQMLFKVFFFLFFNSGGHFVWPSATILAILVDGHKRTYEFFFKIRSVAKEEMLFKDISIFSSGGHLVQWRGTVLAISVKGHKKNICVKLS